MPVLWNPLLFHSFSSFCTLLHSLPQPSAPVRIASLLSEPYSFCTLCRRSLQLRGTIKSGRESYGAIAPFFLSRHPPLRALSGYLSHSFLYAKLRLSASLGSRQLSRARWRPSLRLAHGKQRKIDAGRQNPALYRALAQTSFRHSAISP